MQWKKEFTANRTWIILSKQASRINKQSVKSTYQGILLTVTHQIPDHTKKGAVRENQTNRQARTTSMNTILNARASLFPLLQPDAKQKEWEMETICIMVSICSRPSLDRTLQESTVYVLTLSQKTFWQHGAAAWKPLPWLQLAWG